MYFVDMGNTNAKLKYPDGRISVLAQSEFSLDDFINSMDDHDNSRVAVCSVIGNKFDCAGKKQIHIIDESANFSFTSDVSSPGTDRMLSIEGALSLFKPPFVVVDAGSCITVDFCDIQPQHSDRALNIPRFIGGYICPGFGIALKAMHEHTVLLPELKPGRNCSLISDNTKDAMLSGVCRVTVAGVDKLIPDKYTRIITGGDAGLFTSLSDHNYNYIDDLVFRGMQRIMAKQEKYK